MERDLRTNVDKARQVQSGLDQLRAKFDTDRLSLIKDNFPDIYQDAHNFINDIYQRVGAYYAPWEWWSLKEEEGVAEKIQQKYALHHHRQRPYREDLPPLTDIFFEASEILYEQGMKEVRERFETEKNKPKEV